jgi:Uncharacterized protein conserved in bacteria
MDIMKKYFVCFMIIMLGIVFFSAGVKAQSPIIGTWKTIDDEGPDKGKASSYVEIFEKSGTYFGRITKLLISPADKVCDKCKGDLKNKPLIGMIILQNMKNTGKLDKELGLEYSGGTIMDPDNAETYKCKMWVKDDVLTSRGYIGISLFGRSQQWLRVR